ncbi:MAG: 2-oxo acid dehydrogenase subunit E2 [Sphingobacteriaceae bacterium]|nr:2-oxo acid dehydrogenase subunit E2 [Cytophagaceae bacterium]
MPLTDLMMPKMGESIHEATVLSWLKQPGDRIEADESLLEVATDKVDTEVPSTATGILREILVQEGEVAVIGKPICRIETETAEEVEPTTPTPTNDWPDEKEVIATLEGELLGRQRMAGRVLEEAQTSPSVAPGRFYSPLVLNIAKEEGLSQTELDGIPGTGAEQRVTKHDILAFLKNRGQAPAPSVEKPARKLPASNGAAAYVPSANGQDDIIQMDRMRRMIAERMVDSKRVAPHVTSFVETDMTVVWKWREKAKRDFQAQYGEGLTFTPLLIEAVVKAIRDFPLINVQVDGDKIIVKKSINIGLAVALPSGNLIVPVIHHADQYNLVGLTKKVNDLSRRARENKLKADDLAEGTYTVSNIGTFGNIMGTPIILQPQVAIMAFGAIQKKPAVIETPEGDLLGIRHKMFISHSYDHRVVDGSLGGQFVKRVSDYLEGFDAERKLV